MDASVKTVYKVSVVLCYDTVTENDIWRFLLDRDWSMECDIYQFILSVIGLH